MLIGGGNPAGKCLPISWGRASAARVLPAVQYTQIQPGPVPTLRPRGQEVSGSWGGNHSYTPLPLTMVGLREEREGSALVSWGGQVTPCSSGSRE